VFVSESFDLPLARKLEFLMLGAQRGSGQESIAANRAPDLTGPMVHFFATCGMMRSAMPVK
jgi:hypothetical protein